MENNTQNGGLIKGIDCSGLLGTYRGTPISDDELLKLINGTSISYTYNPVPFMSCCNNNLEPVKLQAEYIVDRRIVNEDPGYAESAIREELARKLAQMMIEEDLIKIQYTDDPAELGIKYRATVKFVQE